MNNSTHVYTLGLQARCVYCAHAQLCHVAAPLQARQQQDSTNSNVENNAAAVQTTHTLHLAASRVIDEIFHGTVQVHSTE
jgi:hypothetical protein